MSAEGRANIWILSFFSTALKTFQVLVGNQLITFLFVENYISEPIKMRITDPQIPTSHSVYCKVFFFLNLLPSVAANGLICKEAALEKL